MTRIPTKAEILAWIAENPGDSSKRDIARAFGLKGAARIDLKRLLKELESEGQLSRRKKTFRDPATLPPVTVLTVRGPDRNGDLTGQPMEWQGEGPAPSILLILRNSDPALGEGNRILARLSEVDGEPHSHEARLIRRIAPSPRRLLGIFRATAEGGRIVPVEKGQERDWRVAPGATHGARDGELVEAEQAGIRPRLGVAGARVIARLGDPAAPRAVSLIAIHQHGIPDDFPDDALDEAARVEPAPVESRTDLRDLPFVTIDPADARDHDDACFAAPDDAPDNPRGHVLWVAIADVAHYVRPGTPLDREARRRGNSTYFPDRVVPMLPEALSGDLCSLHEAVERPVIAVRMRIDAAGNKLSHGFVRAVMRSVASLSYEEVQAARDGTGSDRTAPLRDGIAHLFDAYLALVRAREARQPLDLDLPERRIELSPEGRVVGVALKERLEAHRLIEEFMVLANVAAAEELIARRTPLLFRVHEEPSPEKLDALREVVQASGLALAKGQVLQTRALNRLLEQARGSAVDDLINMATLRAMTQAYYHPKNFGHFGLALRSYAHFTSPIRRYSDLVVHRALITAHAWGNDGLSPAEIESLEATGEHISTTERRSMSAERDTTDRYLAAYLSERVGTELTGRISGVQRFGAFVRLDETGADGLIPVRALGGEYFHYDREAQRLRGAETGAEIGMGQRVTVRLNEAVPVTGGLTLDLLEVEGEPMARNPSGPRKGRGPGRRVGQDRAKSARLGRKVRRTRK